MNWILGIYILGIILSWLWLSSNLDFRSYFCVVVAIFWPLILLIICGIAAYRFGAKLNRRRT